MLLFDPRSFNIFLAAVRIVNSMANTAILQELHFSRVVKRIKRITVERILRRVLKNNLKRWICFYKWVPSAPHFMVSNVAIKPNEKPCA